MSAWLSDIASSHRLQLAVTAAACIGIGATTVLGLQNAKRWYTIHDFKESIPGLNEEHDIKKVIRKHIDTRIRPDL